VPKSGRSIAFEDLWPSYGDYDFNDGFKLSSSRKIKCSKVGCQMDIICNVKSNGAGFTNGIGIEIEKLFHLK
jgi:LruC domain-containing protein